MEWHRNTFRVIGPSGIPAQKANNAQPCIFVVDSSGVNIRVGGDVASL